MDKINEEAFHLAKSLNIQDRVHKIGRQESYVTVKDHKEDFPARISYRLLNPCKTEIGIVSKCILQRVVSDVKDRTNFQHWGNTAGAIDWFANIQDKKAARFLQFDIESFYPSITQDILLKAIDYARNFSYISDKSIDIILHCRKSILFHKGEAWVKKTNSDFDVSMGSHDGAEIADIIDLYLLHMLIEVEHIFEPQDCGV